MPPTVPFELGVGIVENDQVFPVLAGTMDNVVGWLDALITKWLA